MVEYAKLAYRRAALFEHLTSILRDGPVNALTTATQGFSEMLNHGGRGAGHLGRATVMLSGARDMGIAVVWRLSLDPHFADARSDVSVETTDARISSELPRLASSLVRARGIEQGLVYTVELLAKGM